MESEGWRPYPRLHGIVSLIALLTTAAVRAVQSMVKASDFDRKMLLLATQLANESDMKTLLLAVLETLLDTVRKQDGHHLFMEALTLIRCIIRLTVKLMAEPGARRSVGGDSCGSRIILIPSFAQPQICSHLDRSLHHRCVS